MKKLILGTLTVLSLGLFSFTMPKSSSAGVWILPDGSYSIDQGACQTFTPADQQSVAALISSIYNIDVTQLQQDVPVSMQNNAAQDGGCILDKYICELVVYSHFVKWSNCVIAPGSDQANLLQIISAYAQPLN